MKSKTIIKACLTLFLLSIVTLKIDVQSAMAGPRTWTVDDDGSADFYTIQEATNAASNGDSIYVYSGTYYEHLIINKPLTLVGDSKKSTIVDGSGTGTVIKVTADDVAISGFTIQDGGSKPGPSYAGVWISRSTNLTDNHITKNSIGIYVNSFKCNIVENNLTNNGHGISLASSSEVTIEANNFTENTFGISVVAQSSDNMILNNSITKSRDGGHGIYLSDSFNNTISGNNLMNNYHGMWLVGSSNNLIVKNTIANNKLLGIELASSPDNTFYHNNFINNGIPPLAPEIKHILIGIETSTEIWDDGYPSGGNYWDDYTNVEEKSGPNQDQPGSDNIWDNPYVINENNRDRYPSVKPYGEILDITPDEPKPIANTGPSWIDVTSVVLGLAIVAALYWKLKVSKRTKKKRLRKMHASKL